MATDLTIDARRAWQVISEVVATFLLVFVTCGAASIYGEDLKRISQLGQSVAGGLIVTVMIYATGHISGAHMNPAVTLSFACFRHFPWIQVCVCVCAYHVSAAHRSIRPFCSAGSFPLLQISFRVRPATGGAAASVLASYFYSRQLIGWVRYFSIHCC